MDGSSWPCGKLGREAHGGVLDEALHGIELEKIIAIVWGTWESNPGPSVYQVTFPPSELLRAFVKHIHNKYYIKQNKRNGANKK